MIDKQPYEEGALAAVLPLLGECVAEIGMDKPLSAYSRSEVLTLIEVVVTQSNSPRATPAEGLAETARKVLGADRVHVEPKPLAAIDLAVSLLPTAEALRGAVVVTGSITLIGEVLKLKQKEIDQDG